MLYNSGGAMGNPKRIWQPGGQVHSRKMRARWGVHGGDREVAEGFQDPRPDPHTDASRFPECKAAPEDLGGALFLSRRGHV